MSIINLDTNKVPVKKPTPAIEQKLSLVDDKLYLDVPSPQYGDEGVYERYLIMDKETFNSIYKEWIKSDDIK